MFKLIINYFFLFVFFISCDLNDEPSLYNASSTEEQKSIFTYTNHTPGPPIELAVKKKDRFFEPQGFENLKGRLIGGQNFRKGVIRFRALFDPKSPKYQVLYYSNPSGNTHYIIYYTGKKLYLSRGDDRGDIVFHLDKAVIDHREHMYKIVQSQRTSNYYSGYKVRIFQDDKLIREDNFFHNFNAFVSPYFGYDPRKNIPAYRNRDIIGYYTLIDWYQWLYENDVNTKQTVSYSSRGGLALQEDDIFFRSKGFQDGKKGRLDGDRLHEGMIHFFVKFDPRPFNRVQMIYYSKPVENKTQYLVYVENRELVLYLHDGHKASRTVLTDAVVNDDYNSYTILQERYGDQISVELFQNSVRLSSNYLPDSFNAFIWPRFGYDPRPTYGGTRDLIGDYSRISWLPIPSVELGSYIEDGTFFQDFIYHAPLTDVFLRFTNILAGTKMKLYISKEDDVSGRVFVEELLLSQDESPAGVFHAESTISKRMNLYTPKVIKLLGGYSGSLFFQLEMETRLLPNGHQPRTIYKEAYYNTSSKREQKTFSQRKPNKM